MRRYKFLCEHSLHTALSAIEIYNNGIEEAIRRCSLPPVVAQNIHHLIQPQRCTTKSLPGSRWKSSGSPS